MHLFDPYYLTDLRITNIKLTYHVDVFTYDQRTSNIKNKQ